MPLRLIFGRIGSGKTSLCMQEALEKESPVYFVTPEQFTFTAEKRLCEKVNVHGLSGVEVLSFKRLALRVLSQCEGAALPRLDTRTKAILLQKILVDCAPKLTALGTLGREPGSVSALGRLFGEMKRYSVSPKALRAAAERLPASRAKLYDLAFLFEKYEAAIRDRFLDRDDDISRLAAVLAHENLVEGTEIFLDRFDGFDAAEFAAIEAMLRNGTRVTVTVALRPGDENLPAFSLHAQMVRRLLGAARACGAEIEENVILTRPRPAAEGLCTLEEAYPAYPVNPIHGVPEGLALVTASNPLEEVHRAARRILELCRENGYLFRDIAIAARNTASYERYIEAVLPSYGIPFFMDRTINILEHPFTVFILSAMEVLLRGCSYESMFRYIKSGFLRLQPDTVDALENYVLATGIRGDIWKSEEKWNLKLSAYAKQETEEETELTAIADDTRQRIMAPLLAFGEALKSGKTAAEKCDAIYTFLENMKVQRRVLALCKLSEKRGDYALAAEYRGVYNDFIDALDGVCDAFGDENISTRRLYEVLRAALGEFETGIIPSSQDGVSVGSIDRIKGYDVKALLVLGTEDGVFPASPEKGGLLNDGERSALAEQGLEIPTADTKTSLEEEHLIYKCMTIPSEILEFSYSAAGMEGRARRPSCIFTRIMEIFPNVPHRNMLLGLKDDDMISVPQNTLGYLLEALRTGTASPMMLESYGWLLENYPSETKAAVEGILHQNHTVRLSEETVKAYMGGTLSASVSRLEKLAGCPFSYYATYILGAKERQIMRPGSQDAGRFLHDFLDVFSRRLHENGMRWKDIDDAYIDKEFTEIVPMLDRRISTFMLENSPRFAHLFARLRKAVRVGISMLSRHMKKCAFEPLGYELSFGEGGDIAPLTFTLPGGGEVRLSGRIDRADLLRSEKGNFVRIIDYKSGAKSFELDDVYDGLNLQLAVYISALCAPQNAIVLGENVKPSGMLYFRLVDPVVDAHPEEDAAVLEKMRRQKFKLNGLLVSDEDILKAMDSEIGASSDVLPARIQSTGVRGSVASGAQFEILDAYVKKTVSRLLKALGEGNIEISPYKKGDISACTYCNFAAFCAHDGSRYRHLEKAKAEEIWQAMEAEVCK